MNSIDIVLLGVLILGLVRGFWRGLFVEITSLVALIAGVYGAFHFSFYAANFLKEQVNWNENSINIVAFISTLIIIILAISLAGKALTKLASFAALGLLNKVLGAVFGCFKIAFILSAVMIMFEKLNINMPYTEPEDQKASVLYEPVASIIPIIFPNVMVNGKPLGDDLEKDVLNLGNPVRSSYE